MNARRGVRGLRENELRAILAAGDAASVAVAAFLGPVVWEMLDPTFLWQPGLFYWQIGSVALWTGAIQLLGGGDLTTAGSTRRSLGVTGQALFGVALVALALFYVSPFFAPRGATLTTLPLAAVAVLVWRAAYARLLRSQVFQRRVAIVGTDPVALQVASLIRSSEDMPYRVVAFIAEAGAAGLPDGVPVVGADDMWAQVRRLGVEQLIIGNYRGLPPRLSDELVRCFEHGVEAQPARTVYEELTGRVMGAALDASWYGHLPTHTHRLYMPLKRVTDVALSLVLVVVTFPLVLAAMAAIAATSPGPVLISQERLGQRGRPFRLRKLRSMRRDAEPGGEARWAGASDERAGRLGRFLRRSHIDELPQLWNVLRGEMSLIGPRPERPEFVERLSRELPLYRARLLLRPGITGWAQVRHGYAASVTSSLEKLEYDLYYLRHLGPVLDLSIALRTVAVVLGLRGR